MIRIQHIILILMVVGLAFTQGDVTAKQGTSGVQSLLFSPDAKFAAMGNAVVGYENANASAVFYNPATLVFSDGPSFTFGNINWFADIRFIAAAASYRFNERHTVAGHIRMLDSGSMDETTVIEPTGTGRSFSMKDFVMGVSYATFLTDRFSFGANLQLVQESEDLEDFSATGWSIDLGTFYRTGFRSLKLGMSIRNFGSEMDWDETFDDYGNGDIESIPESFRSFHMPLLFQVGLSYEFLEDDEDQQLIVGLDGVHPNDALERFNIGAEYQYLNIIALRAGLYTNHDSASLMAGFGLNLEEFVQQRISVDYSVSRYGILGFVHQFSVGYEL